MSGYLGVWVSECLNVWMFGCMDVWMSGCLGLWRSGCAPNHCFFNGFWCFQGGPLPQHRLQESSERLRGMLPETSRVCALLSFFRSLEDTCSRPLRPQGSAGDRLATVRGRCLVFRPWMSGCLDVWMSVCLDVWMSGCLGIWVSGCLDVWTSGCLDV